MVRTAKSAPYLGNVGYIDSDAVFGVKESLIREYKEHPAGVAPDGRKMDVPYATINYDFVMAKEG